MSKLTADKTSGSFPSAVGLGGMMFESMKVTTDTVADEMPEGRFKYIHTVGNVGSVKFVAVENTPYTGVF